MCIRDSCHGWFKSDIHQNKDWNQSLHSNTKCLIPFKSDIHQNKDWNPIKNISNIISILFKSDIHQNKDWNSMPVMRNRVVRLCSRATSTKTRIETQSGQAVLIIELRVQERHPPKQGLKHSIELSKGIIQFCVQERHPPKQGLKLFSFSYSHVTFMSSRATSTKTRIETRSVSASNRVQKRFKSDIHQNKDWNPLSNHLRWKSRGSRATSTKTRIETQKSRLNIQSSQSVQERHPPKQGLKPMSELWHTMSSPVQERHPPKQGLKHIFYHRISDSISSSRATSTKTRIETRWSCHLSFVYASVQERHPPKQGLKLCINIAIIKLWAVQERHPPKQGLKLQLWNR